MVLRERWGAAAAGLFRITGGDVDEAALAAARRAVYPESALRALPAAAAARWFTSAGGGERRLHDSLRAAVRFEPLNVLDPEFAAALPAQDVILYRNLSIYFDTATRRMALNNLQRALAPGGVLLVGTTEVMANDLGLFALHVEDGVWYFGAGPPAGSNGSAAPGAAAAAGAPPRPAADTSVPAAGDEARAARARYTRALQQAHAGDLAEALAALRDGPATGDDPASAPELAPEAAALEARLLFELGDLANAKSAAERLVGTDAWSASGLGLLARIAQLEDDPEAAIGHAERAVYARPEYWPALLLLAELYRARGRSAHAARTYRRLLRQLDDETKAAANLTSTLSERTLALRMLPLATVFDPAVRMVRALAGELGKDVRCETHGGEIALERQIITKLADCLGHCLRNAVDHGIEDAAGRHAAGKPERSRIQLTARHASGGVLIELSDDGRGLDRARILAKAEREGLIDAADAEQLTDEQAFELLFQPGFSTSEIITDLSGRGVGLDVVKHIVVDELNGAVSVNSRPGEGTRFLFKLPLSLAVMRVLVLGSGGRRVALPAQHVEESLRLRPEETITIAERPALVVRNELIPLVTLNEVLDPEQPGAGAAPPAARMVVIIGVRRLKLGLLVDTLVDERDMVVKSLPPHLQRCHLVGGVVSTGERALVCVLQAQTLIERARRVRVQGTATAAARPAAEQPHVLVADDSLNTREIEKELLEAHGYRVTIARDGLDAWHKAQAQPFDAVLSDVEMPRLDGFALTERLRAQDGYEATPIVLVTSRQKEEDKRRGAEVGADAYIVKGDFDQTSLLETLDNLLGRPPS